MQKVMSRVGDQMNKSVFTENPLCARKDIAFFSDDRLHARKLDYYLKWVLKNVDMNETYTTYATDQQTHHLIGSSQTREPRNVNDNPE